ncbi:MAG: DUF1273 domain-containing protein [Clostridia bacterium]|nr:DUF1273 domain-containing protein [Clostridia bacterium]
MVITFCGHSNYTGNSADEKRLLKLIEEVAQGKRVEFYLGGYGGFDSFALKCAKKYQENHSEANIIFITPYLDSWLNTRKSILEKTYDTILYPELENVPKKFTILKRNEWMVSQADYIFCYVRTHYGGAYKTLLYADKHKKPYINLYQGDYELY